MDSHKSTHSFTPNTTAPLLSFFHALATQSPSDSSNSIEPNHFFNRFTPLSSSPNSFTKQSYRPSHTICPIILPGPFTPVVLFQSNRNKNIDSCCSSIVSQ